jgi:hypothetical protein
MRFYVLEQFPKPNASQYRTDFMDASEPPRLGDAPRCPKCRNYIGGRKWLPPYRVELELVGGGFGDVVFGTRDSVLISERFRDLFQAAGLRGLEGFDPVEVVRVKGARKAKEQSPRYYRVDIARGQASIDDVASGIERDRPVTCDLCRASGPRRAKRLALVPGSWSGADIFYAHGLAGRIFASDRFKIFCDSNAIRNAALISAEDYSFDMYSWENTLKP